MSRKLKLASSRSKKTNSAVEDLVCCPTVDERLKKVYRLVVLTMATANTDAPAATGLDSELLMQAIGATLSDVEQEIAWLQELPVGLLSQPAPDPDQAEAIARAAKGGA